MFDAGQLSVVIPTRERWGILAGTLDALAAQTVRGFEVVVVVDGSDQEVPPMPGVRVMTVPHAGPGAARNAGVAASERPLLMFLGDDIVPSPDAVQRHLEAHDAHPADDHAVLGHIAWHPRAGGRRILNWLDWSNTQFEYRNLAGSAGQDVGFGRFYSSNVSLKRALFTAAGGFDEAFSYCYEDLDLAWRLSLQGMKLVYEPRAASQHLHSYTWSALRSRFRCIGEGERLMAGKHEWFEPFFARRVAAAADQPGASPAWAVLVDLVPPSMTATRRRVERLANHWYYQRLAPEFQAGWDAG